MAKCNPDIVRERSKCTFNVAELTHLIDGSEEKTRKRRETEKLFLDDPDFHDEVPPEYLSHVERYELAVKKGCLLLKKRKDYKKDERNETDPKDAAEMFGGMFGTGILTDGSPFALNNIMFIPAIMQQGTEEQQAKWLSRAKNYEIIGTYAQTELGHGTFIRGLETTAEYDPKTEEFILNSPTLTSYKWWPGGLGHTTNYAVVVAQLHSKGERHGIHPFMVQLRDEETHMPLPGIKIGEIGFKMGSNSNDNGYLGLDNVRIPRTNMLMKNAQVLKDGTFVKALNQRSTYSTMMLVRTVMIKDLVTYLAKATIIATRYSAVRRQSQIKPNEPEPQILDFVTQQYKLFPSIATCFALHSIADWLWEMYEGVKSELDGGNLERLPELHAMLCCLKAVSTADVAQTVETCRLACGGHGYMTSSNLPGINGLVAAGRTIEGENTVLLLQTARFLMKMWFQSTSNQSLSPMTAYLSNKTMKPWRMSVESIIDGFQKVAAGKIELCAKSMQQRMASGMSQADAWNATSIQLVDAAEAHCKSIIIEKFHERIKSIRMSVSLPLANILTVLVELYSVHWTLKYSGDFLRFTTITGADLEDLQEWFEDLLVTIRPNAVGLVDSFDIPDKLLNSALGVWDGNVYEKLMEEAMRSPLNAKPVDDSYFKYQKPFMTRTFKSNL